MRNAQGQVVTTLRGRGPVVSPRELAAVAPPGSGGMGTNGAPGGGRLPDGNADQLYAHGDGRGEHGRFDTGGGGAGGYGAGGYGAMGGPPQAGVGHTGWGGPGAAAGVGGSSAMAHGRMPGGDPRGPAGAVDGAPASGHARHTRFQLGHMDPDAREAAAAKKEAQRKLAEDLKRQMDIREAKKEREKRERREEELRDLARLERQRQELKQEVAAEAKGKDGGSGDDGGAPSGTSRRDLFAPSSPGGPVNPSPRHTQAPQHHNELHQHQHQQPPQHQPPHVNNRFGDGSEPGRGGPHDNGGRGLWDPQPAHHGGPHSDGDSRGMWQPGGGSGDLMQGAPHSQGGMHHGPPGASFRPPQWADGNDVAAHGMAPPPPNPAVAAELLRMKQQQQQLMEQQVSGLCKRVHMRVGLVCVVRRNPHAWGWLFRRR